MAREGFAHWAIVELFGHARIAGKVTEEQIGGASFIRVDVPELEVRGSRLDAGGRIPVETRPAFTRYFGPAAIYSITPVDEDIARRAAEAIRPEPVTVYLPAALAIAAQGDDDADDSGGDYADDELEDQF
jgi:hypothetical protein